MEYEGRICRAPMERASYMLPVMVGCSYNKCKFCNLFRDLKYRELPLEQVEEELQRVKNLGGNPRKIFLGDGNAFGLKMDRLRAILDLIDKYFPDCQMINMDATVTSIRLKSDEELQELYDRKVRHLYLGIESGLDDVLKFMRKEHTQDQAYKEIAKIDSQYLKPVLDLFSTTATEICCGQQYDMEFEQRMDVTIAEYLEMIRLKTAVLLACSLKEGAIVAGASAEDAENLYNYGILVGLGFQLMDDLLDVYGDSSNFGKKIGGDILCNKKTFLFIDRKSVV